MTTSPGYRAYSLGIGTWGALLGQVAAVAMNVYLRSRHAWFGAALLLVVFLPVFYYLVSHFLVGPLNEATRSA